MKHRCGGHSSAYGFCGADDCSRCHPGGSDLTPAKATRDQLLDYLAITSPDSDSERDDQPHAELLRMVDLLQRANALRSFAEVIRRLN